MNKKVLVTQSSMPGFDEYVDEIKGLWNSKWLTNMGEKHAKLQNELKKYLYVDNVELFTNGHMALEMSLNALGLNGEVITTPFTFASTIHAIVRNGLKPVFCDINEDDFTIDVSKLENLITEKTCAIVPVHVYGNICNIEELDNIARKYKLKIVYDAAHTFGVTYKGKGIGSFGDISCFSFHATKVFHTIEGGAACFSNTEIGNRLRKLKNFGIDGTDIISDVGVNAKMNEFCAAMGICNLRHIDDEIKKRKKVVERYKEILENIPGIKMNGTQKNVDTNYAYCPVCFDEKRFGSNRDVVLAKLLENDIVARKYFFPVANKYKCYEALYKKERFPVAERISLSVLTLPLYADLSIETVDKICEIIISCKK